MSYYDNYRKYMNENGGQSDSNNTSSEVYVPVGNAQQTSGYQAEATGGGAGGGAGGFSGGNDGNGNNFNEPPKAPKKKKPQTAVVVASVLAGGMILGGAVGWSASQNRQQTLYNDANVAQTEDTSKSVKQVAAASDPNKSFSIEDFTKKLDSSGNTSKSASQIYKDVNPSIVSVETKYTVRQGKRSAETTGAGSGIIISDDGYILTNAHVVEGSDSINIVTSDGEKHEVELVGTDTQTDLAVLKFDNSQKTYVAAPLGDSDSVEIGEMVVAIGNPLGELANSLSIGAISAVDRTIEMDNGSMTFLQTTAAISPGNSGGALINSYGEVVGVTTAKSMGSGVEGIGYAIPINNAKTVIEELINNGYVSGRPMLGINVEAIDDEIAQVYNMPEGLYITAIGQGSAAEKAGLKVGDIIVSFNGKEVKDRDELNEAKNACKPGDTVSIEFYRKAKLQKVSLTLEEQKPETQDTTTQEEATVPETQQRNPFSNDSGNYEYYYGNGSDSQELEEFFRSFFG